MQAKKSLGQHFLKDEGILKKIADFARIKKTDAVVEVGPGEGTLTKFLLEKARKVIAVEKDGRMADLLKNKFSEEIKEGRLEIVENDILDIEMQEVSALAGPKYILVGNIPYYITGILFKKFLEAENQPGSITFVVQREVAERIIARDGKESVLSISVKAYGEPVYGGTIKAGSFHPAPKVDSAILHINGISRKNFEQISESAFFEILKAGFAHKRKLLIKNLAEAPGLKADAVKLKKAFDKCAIPEKARAENLKVSGWICLAKELS